MESKDLKKLQKVFQERDELATKNKELEARVEAVLPLEPLLRAKELGEKLKELARYNQKIETQFGVYEISLNPWGEETIKVETSFKPSKKSLSLEGEIILSPKMIPDEIAELSVAMREALQREDEIEAILAELGPFRKIILELANWLRLPEKE